MCVSSFWSRITSTPVNLKPTLSLTKMEPALLILRFLFHPTLILNLTKNISQLFLLFLPIFFRALVQAAKVFAVPAAKTTSVLGWNFFTDLFSHKFFFWFTPICFFSSKILLQIYTDLFFLTNSSTELQQVTETGCTMTNPALLASEYSLTKDECQSFCTGF